MVKEDGAGLPHALTLWPCLSHDLSEHLSHSLICAQGVTVLSLQKTSFAQPVQYKHYLILFHPASAFLG